MSSVSPQVPKSATSIYGGNLDFLWSPLLYPVVAAVITIALSLVFFCNLCKTQNKSREKSTSIQRQPARDGHNPGISIASAQASTTLRPQSIKHSPGAYPGIVVVPSIAPPTIPPSHSLREKDPRSREDSRTSVSIVPATVDHTIKEARNQGNQIQTEISLATPERPSLHRGDGAVQSREAKHGIDPDFSFLTEAPTVAIEPCSVVCRGGVMDGERVPSTPLFQRSSIFQITNTNINTIGNNVDAAVRFGDWQYTEIQRHTQIATLCFEIMDKRLKCNILDLSDPARFMSNEDGLKEDAITDEQIQEKIPQQLRYACIYWVNHLEAANGEDEALKNGLEKFANEHMLYWLEVLSLIGKLDSAHHAIGVVLKLTTMSSDLHQLLSDILRFIGKFYELIKRSALHTYHSALLFTPSGCLLYRRYIKDALCSIEGGPEKWDALVANTSHGERVNIIKFSLSNALFISCSNRESRIWDAATSTPISTIPGYCRFTVASDFSTVASFEDKTIIFYNVNGSATETMITTSSRIQLLAFSSESRRVAAALSDGTVWLWDSSNAELIDRFDGFERDANWSLQFSPTGTRLAYSSAKGIKLRDGISGKSIANLQCGTPHMFEFSGDGSRIASLSFYDSLTLWNSKSGRRIATVSSAGQCDLAISANGSLLATVDDYKVTLWSNHLAKIKVLELGHTAWSMAFSQENIFAMATNYDVKFYNVNTHSFIHTLPLRGGNLKPIALAFSPDCARLAVGNDNGTMSVWDIRGIDASPPSSEGNASAVTALALSRDCSRLACGFENGGVELWETSPTKRRIDPLTFRSKMKINSFDQFRHTEAVRTLEFDPDGRLFASGSVDETIKLWNGGDGVLHGTLRAPSWLPVVALSKSMLVAAGNGGVTLWSLDMLSPIHCFTGPGLETIAYKVSIAENSTHIAALFQPNRITLLDVINRTTIATFDIRFPFNFWGIHAMTFLPDNSQLVLQSDKGEFLSLNLIDNHTTEGPVFGHLIQLPNTPLWHGVPVFHCQDSEQHYFAALFSQRQSSVPVSLISGEIPVSPVPVLWIPRDLRLTAWTQGAYMIALSCKDGRIILLRLPTSHVG